MIWIKACILGIIPIINSINADVAPWLRGWVVFSRAKDCHEICNTTWAISLWNFHRDFTIHVTVILLLAPLPIVVITMRTISTKVPI
jgi:hypothetical protein